MIEPSVGAVLGGKYVVEGILGRGGMGVVYAARHRELDQRVAIKCLLPHALVQPEVVERFAREARAAAKIHGEHVARVLDVGRFEDGTPFMVMECLRGHDLAEELIRRGPPSIHDAIRYSLETCEALAQAHAARIVHRDLKPSNLFLAETPGRRPIVKVLDFGISKFVDAASGAITKTASVMGTPYYMSPEQLLSSKSVDERSDIWALGVILYELLCGNPPFTGETAPEVVAKIIQNTPASLRPLRPELPVELEHVVLRCISTKPEDRFVNVAQFAAALVPFAADGDRESAVAIARVLGVSEGAGDGSALPARTPEPTGSARPLPAQGTSPSLVLSSPELQTAPGARRGWFVGLVGGLVVAAGAGGLLLLRAAPVHPPVTAGAGSVGTAMSTISPSPATALEVLPPLDLMPASASAGVASALAPPTAAAFRSERSPLPARSVHPSAPPTSAPSSMPAVPSSATSHNPLDLQIK